MNPKQIRVIRKTIRRLPKTIVRKIKNLYFRWFVCEHKNRIHLKWYLATCKDCGACLDEMCGE